MTAPRSSKHPARPSSASSNPAVTPAHEPPAADRLDSAGHEVLDYDPSVQASHGVWLVARLKQSTDHPDPYDTDDADDGANGTKSGGGDENPKIEFQIA